MYCSHLTETPEPTYAEALHFFQTLHRGDAVPLEVTEFRAWLRRALDDDRAKQVTQGRTNGLINHILVTQNWFETDDDVPESDEHARSSIDTGKQVDAELAALHAGVAHDYVDRYTTWLVIYFCQRQWLPLAFQTPIWATDGGSVRTSADIIVYDLVRRRFALVELKTGYDNNYDAALRARTDLDYFEKTRRTMCHLQLGWMYFELDRAAHPWPLDAYVLRVSTKHGVRQPEPLQHEVADFYRHLYAAAGRGLTHLAAPDE